MQTWALWPLSDWARTARTLQSWIAPAISGALLVAWSLTRWSRASRCGRHRIVTAAPEALSDPQKTSSTAPWSSLKAARTAL